MASQADHVELNGRYWGDSAEFTLPHGEMFRPLRSIGFAVEDLIEIHAPNHAHRDFPYVSREWARDWPSEEIWKVRWMG